jgi:hypothetical protein
VLREESGEIASASASLFSAPISSFSAGIRLHDQVYEFSANRSMIIYHKDMTSCGFSQKVDRNKIEKRGSDE